jgi:hypothetical protein
MENSPNKISFQLYAVNDIPRMQDVYVQKPIPYSDDGVTVTGKFHAGLYGDVVVQKDIWPNLRVNSIVVDMKTNKVVYRDHFNIFDTDGVESKTRVYVPHLKAKNINYKTNHLCVYVREGLFADYRNIFSNNFNTEISADGDSSNTITITFSRSEFDLEEDFNKQAFINACKKNQLESSETGINWNFPGSQKFCVNCTKDDEHHKRYIASNGVSQIGFCIVWEDLISNNINCPACVAGKIRDHKKALIMDILNTEDKNLMCEKIINFLDSQIVKIGV